MESVDENVNTTLMIHPDKKHDSCCLWWFFHSNLGVTSSSPYHCCPECLILTYDKKTYCFSPNQECLCCCCKVVFNE